MAEDRILAVRFDDAEQFRREYAANIANGGIFVSTSESVELRERVCVGIELVWSGESLLLPGEVVHVIPPELAPVGVTPGVAVQLDRSGAELREQVRPYLEPGTASTGRAPALPERRTSTRGVARLPALLRIEGDELIDGRTRNLSSAGLLFAIEGEALARDRVLRGQPVTVFLQHPETFEDLGLPGRVARRLGDATGGIRALAVAFDGPGELSPELVESLEGLQQREHARNLGAVRGELEGEGCAGLLERFARSVPEGTLILDCGADEGRITMREGRWLTAELGAVRGRKALVRLLSWEHGLYEFHPSAEPSTDEERLHLDATLLDAAREVDELRRLQSPRFAPELRLSTVPDVLATFEPDKLESAVLDLAAVGQPLGRLVDVIPESDLEVYRAIDDLLERGALTPVG